jgi:polar amino acid transport system substrate-binding protein
MKSKEELKKFIINDYIGDSYAKTLYPKNEGFKTDISSNYENAFMKLSKNRGDIIFANKTTADIFLKHKSGKNLKQIKLDFISPKIEFFFCIRKSHPEAKKIIELFEKKLQIAIRRKKIKNIYLYYTKDIEDSKNLSNF